MIEGIIYLYESPNRKRYVGQTTNEKQRRLTFCNLNRSYGGAKIDNARKSIYQKTLNIWFYLKGYLVLSHL